MIGTEEAWALEELPKTLVVVGAGASGTEIASRLRAPRHRGQLFEGLDRVLPTEDADISKLAERGFKKQGIEVHTEHVRRERRDRRRQGDVHATARSRARPTGSSSPPGAGPTSRASGSTTAGVKLDEQRADRGRRRAAHERSRASTRSATSCPARRSPTRPPTRGSSPPRTPPGCETHPIDYVDIPRATFCTPNVASFGLTEEQAKEAGHDVVVGKVQYGAVGAGTVYGDRTGLVKIVGDKKYGELLGGHIVGAKATELIQELVNVKRARGRLPRGRPHGPRPPDALRGRHGGRPRRRWLAHPRLSRRSRLLLRPRRAPRRTSRPSGVLQSDAGRGRVGPGRRDLRAPSRRLPLRRGARHRARGRRARARRRAGCSRCAGPTRSRSTATSRCSPRRTPSRSGARSPFSLAAFRQAFAGGRALDDATTS